jgi:hypothetical protein
MLAGQANGAPVQCPSISFTRTPVTASAHRAAHRKPRLQAAATHHHVARRRAVTKVAAKHASGPRPASQVSNALPVLAPILPPDTMPATTPVLAPGVQPATPIIGYRLKRSVKMVACEPVPQITTAQDLISPRGPASETTFIPATFRPPAINEFQTSPPGPPGPPGGPNPPGPPNCCNSPPFSPPTPPHPPGAVPEPATWAMLIVGFFGLGAQLRRSNRRARSAGAAPNQAG